MALRNHLHALLRTVPRTRWVALMFLVVAWAVYDPALNRVFVTDHLWYVAELDGSRSLVDGLRHVDYAVSRRYWKGDDALFRPLLFVWLAAGNRLFSYHHVWWNVANLFLHVLVALALYRFLAAIRPSPFALPVALLFLVLKGPLEAVVWNHLGGYLWACFFLLIGLGAFLRLAGQSGETATWDAHLWYALAFSAAGLFYEVIVLISMLGAVVVAWLAWRRGRRIRWAQMFLLALPAVLFFSLYLFHVLRVERLSYVDKNPRIFAMANVVSALPRSVETLAWWTVNVALPSAFQYHASPFNRLSKEFLFSVESPLHLFNALLSLAALVVLARALSWRHLRHALPLLFLLVGAAFAYAIVICLGRPQKEVIEVTYYLYIFGLLLSAFAYALLDFERIRGGRAAAAWALVSALIALHAWETSGVNRLIGRANQAASRYLDAVSRFVDGHKAEPDFTFAIVAPPRSVDPEVSLQEGYPDDPAAAVHVRRVTQILFQQYTDETSPKYVIDGRDALLGPRQLLRGRK